eukprot:jgi/Pico_ML_1/55757/g1402.t1
MSSKTRARKARRQAEKDAGGEDKGERKETDRKEGKKEIPEDAGVGNQAEGLPKRNRNRRSGSKVNREKEKGDGNPHPRATSTETPPGRGNHTFGSFIPKQFTSRLEQNEAPRASKKNSLTSYSRVAQRALDNSLRSAMTVE